MLTMTMGSMNENFIPFSLTKASLVVALVAVFAMFTFLQYAVPRCCKNPQWWKVLLQEIKNWVEGIRIKAVIRRVRRDTIARGADGEAPVQDSVVP